MKFFISNLILGLEYLHEKGFIHKDMKPDNFLFDKNGYLHITDLGETKVITSSEKKGSGPYMSPEIRYKQSHGKSVDYYALGIVTYELLYNRRPFNESNLEKMF